MATGASDSFASKQHAAWLHSVHTSQLFTLNSEMEGVGVSPGLVNMPAHKGALV